MSYKSLYLEWSCCRVIAIRQRCSDTTELDEKFPQVMWFLEYKRDRINDDQNGKYKL